MHLRLEINYPTSSGVGCGHVETLLLLPSIICSMLINMRVQTVHSSPYNSRSFVLTTCTPVRQVELTDGVNTVFGMEYKPVKQLSQDTKPGLKV